MHSRAHAFTGAPPLDLDIIVFSGTCLSNTCFMFILLSDVFGTRALRTHALCLFCLHIIIRDLFILLSTNF